MRSAAGKCDRKKMKERKTQKKAILLLFSPAPHLPSSLLIGFPKALSLSLSFFVSFCTGRKTETHHTRSLTHTLTHSPSLLSLSPLSVSVSVSLQNKTKSKKTIFFILWFLSEEGREGKKEGEGRKEKVEMGRLRGRGGLEGKRMQQLFRRLRRRFRFRRHHLSLFSSLSPRLPCSSPPSGTTRQRSGILVAVAVVVVVVVLSSRLSLSLSPQKIKGRGKKQARVFFSSKFRLGFFFSSKGKKT